MQLKIYMSSAAALLGFKFGEGQQRGLALPRMAPKRAAAKAKAAALAAQVATSNARRDRRREACRALNQLANELGVGHAGLDAKEASGSEVERLIRLLERRVRKDGPLERLRGAAKAFADNGGELSAEVVSEEASLSIRRGNRGEKRRNPAAVLEFSSSVLDMFWRIDTENKS